MEAVFPDGQRGAGLFLGVTTMNHIAFDDWCCAATKLIRYGPDREAVCAELQAHLEDKYDALVSGGMDPDAAAAKALDDMGSAGEIAPQLAAVHRPWLGYLYSTVRLLGIWVAVVAGFLALYCLSDWCTTQLEVTYDHDYTAYFGGNTWQPNDGTIAEGYFLWVPEAAVDAQEERLYFKLEITNLPWVNGSCPIEHFWAVDSEGNVYEPMYGQRDQGPLQVTSHYEMMSVGLDIYGMMLTGFDCEAEWVELHYDRDGRDIVLRIDLTGGGTA